MRVQQIRLQPPRHRRRRRRLANRREMGRLRELAAQARVEVPNVIWVGDVRDATRRLERNLTHQQQPSLFDAESQIAPER